MTRSYMSDVGNDCTLGHCAWQYAEHNSLQLWDEEGSDGILMSQNEFECELGLGVHI